MLLVVGFSIRLGGKGGLMMVRRRRCEEGELGVQMGLRSGVGALRCSFRLVRCLSRGSLLPVFGCLVGCKVIEFELRGGDDAE